VPKVPDVPKVRVPQCGGAVVLAMVPKVLGTKSLLEICFGSTMKPWKLSVTRTSTLLVTTMHQKSSNS
jgi:hypothetical protein